MSTTSVTLLSQLLATTTVDSVVQQQKLILIDSRDPLPFAFHKLVKNNIYSAPVYDSIRGEYIGFLDLLDIVCFIVQISEDIPSCPDLFELLEQMEKFDFQHATRVVGLSSKNMIPAVQTGEPLSKAIDIFVKYGAHRVPILEKNGQIKSVLTQSSLIQWLNKNHTQIPIKLRHKTVKELNMGSKKVVTVSFDAKAIDAFRLMAKNNIHAVAVVDENGYILSNLSAKDIKLLVPDAVFTKLYKPTLEWVQMTRASQIKTTVPSFTTTLKGTLDEVIQKVAILRVHRLYIEDEHRFPIGVISLGDILTALTTQAEEST